MTRIAAGLEGALARSWPHCEGAMSRRLAVFHPGVDFVSFPRHAVGSKLNSLRESVRVFPTIGGRPIGQDLLFLQIAKSIESHVFFLALHWITINIPV
jgi:hypothetical protein